MEAKPHANLRCLDAAHDLAPLLQRPVLGVVTKPKDVPGIDSNILFFLQLKKVYIPPEAAIDARNKLNLPFDVSLRVVYLVVMYLDNRYIKIAFQQIPHKQTSKFGIRPKHDSPSSLG